MAATRFLPAQMPPVAPTAPQHPVAPAESGRPARRARFGGRIVAAAMALPGMVAAPAAMADSAPEHGTIAFKMLHYQDEQPGLKRIKVKAPSLYLLAPVASKWALEASAVHDEVSGASPRYYSDVSGASRMHDKRNAVDAKLTRYFERASLGVGASQSREHDYRSQAVSVDGRISSDDNNRSWNFGLGHSSDRINPVNQIVIGERKRTTDAMVGVTQAWSQRDLVQANLTLSSGRGYYDDPYKLYDIRPRQRRQQILLLRWNHRMDSFSATLRSSYRYYQDSFGIRAHTVEAAWVQPVSERVTLTPLLRYYSQRAADFYYDPVSNAAVYPAPLGSPLYYSSDQRLSAFGAITWGFKVDWQVTPQWHTDFKLESYQQRSDWRVGGNGSPGLAPFKALWAQVGVSTTF